MKTFSGKKTCERCGNIIQDIECLYCPKNKHTDSKGYSHQSHRDFEKNPCKQGSIEVGEQHMVKIRQILGVRGLCGKDRER